MIEELKKRVCERPFKPFCIVLKDEKRLYVTRIAQVGIGKTIFTYADDSTSRFMDMAISRIASLETLGSVTAS